MRGFIAIEIEPDSSILSLMRDISRSGVKVKAVEKENMHLTLKFLGEIDEEQVEMISEGMRSLDKYVSFSINLHRVGAFPSNSRPKVIWVGVDYPDVLEDIWRNIEDISEKAGIERERRGFSPHITLARVKDNRNAWRLRDLIDEHRNDDFGERRVMEIKLKESVLTPSGPIYSDVLSVRLRE